MSTRHRIQCKAESFIDKVTPPEHHPAMHHILDLDRYPLQDLHQPRARTLIEKCRSELAAQGMFNLEGFVRPQALERITDELKPVFTDGAFTHRRSHNIYFQEDIPGLPAGHPALGRFETINHTVCADQIPDSLICAIYEWPQFIRFLAAAVGKPRLYAMADPLARANVLTYHHGEALNWHFDRSEFTTTLLLQAPESGGRFQYRRDLRTESDPNYDQVAQLVSGADNEVQTLELSPGTLNIFKGRYTAHRVTPVVGETERMVAVFCYYERPGVAFSTDEQIGFYGRTSHPA